MAAVASTLSTLKEDPRSAIVRLSEPDAKYLTESTWGAAAEWVLHKPSNAEAKQILDRYGYQSTSPTQWCDRAVNAPHLVLSIERHIEQANHTWYMINCKLSNSKNDLLLQWWAPRRLCHLRSGLYEPVRLNLEDSYASLFKDTHFASRGGMNGTTVKLHQWLVRLSHLLNDRQVPPIIGASLLYFLQAPDPSGENSSKLREPMWERTPSGAQEELVVGEEEWSPSGAEEANHDA